MTGWEEEEYARMTLQRGAPIGWEAPGEDRRKVASEPGGERARRKGWTRTDRRFP